MKRVLILAYDYPPYNSVGAQRPYGWYKYFKYFDLYPIIVTRHCDANILNEIDYIKPSSKQSTDIETTDTATIIRVPYKPNLRDRLFLKYGFSKYNTLRKFITFYNSIFKFITFSADNTSNIYDEADKYLQNNKCDYILATGEPFILFRYAHLLAKKHNIPWFADYRDGWTTNLSICYFSSFKRFINKYIIRHFEKKYVSTAKCFFTVSDYSKNELSKIHPNKAIHIVTNGFIEDEYDNLSDISQNKDKFTIAYAGSLYSFQPLELFLEGAKEFIATEKIKDISIEFYGLTFYKEQQNRVLNYDSELSKFIIAKDRVSKVDLLKELKKAHTLLLLASDIVDSSCAKVYDYLPLNRKILLVKNDKDLMEKIIDNCNAGYKCSSKEDIVDALKTMYNEFKSTGKVNQQTINIDNYSRKYQTSALAGLVLNK